MNWCKQYSFRWPFLWAFVAAGVILYISCILLFNAEFALLCAEKGWK